jgi:hypothetical protein
MWIGRNRKARVTYGFDEIALVPGSVTINPNEVDTSFQLGPHKIGVPILASAMDGVVDVRSSGAALGAHYQRGQRRQSRLFRHFQQTAEHHRVGVGERWEMVHGRWLMADGGWRKTKDGRWNTEPQIQTDGRHGLFTTKGHEEHEGGGLFRRGEVA